MLVIQMSTKSLLRETEEELCNDTVSFEHLSAVYVIG